jgi:peptidyl-Lys metalloendopeptidase
MLVLSWPSLAACAAAPGLVARLDQVHTPADGSAAKVRFTLANEGSRTWQVTDWLTPFEGLRANILEVLCDGVEVPYRGSTVKRSRPNAWDYFALPPGTARAVVVDLARAYPLPSSGRCTVRWRGRLVDALAAEQVPAASRRSLHAVRLRSDAVSFVLGGGTGAREAPSGVIRAEATGFVGCNDARQRTLNEALPAGRRLATAARAYLQGVPVDRRPTDARYTAWFGSYAATRYDRVSGRYGQIDAAAGRSLTFDCTESGECAGRPESCDPGDFAFTCAGGAGRTIWLCDAFWTAPALGEDSQAGTVVHELSHWFGTDDIDYGCEDCQDLATDDPEAATKNADNCEYFAENFGVVCP